MPAFRVRIVESRVVEATVTAENAVEANDILGNRIRENRPADSPYRITESHAIQIQESKD